MKGTSTRARCIAHSSSEASAHMLLMQPFCRAISPSATAFASACCLSRPSRRSWATLSDPSCCLCSSSSCCHLHISRHGTDLKFQSIIHRLPATAMSAHFCLAHPSSVKGSNFQDGGYCSTGLVGSYVHLVRGRLLSVESQNKLVGRETTCVTCT
jgi:hypothetical protein